MSRLSEVTSALMPHLMLAPIALPMFTAALLLLLREEQQRLKFGFRCNNRIQLKVIRSPVGFDQGSRGGRMVLIPHRQVDIAHIIGRGVSQQEQHHHRQHKCQDQGARVAHDLDEFLAD